MDSYGAALHVLESGGASRRNLDALDAFLVKKADQLFAPPASTDKSKDDSETERLALLTGLVSTLDSGSAPAVKQDLAQKRAQPLYSEDKLFPGIFKRIGDLGSIKSAASTSTEGDLSGGPLLQDSLRFVYQSLFSVIPNTSKLIITWFEAAVGPAHFFSSAAPTEKALALLVTAQFIDLHQNFEVDDDSYAYFKDPKALTAIHHVVTAARASDDIPSEYLLLWGLVVHNVALRYKANPAQDMGSFLRAAGAKDGDSLDSIASELLSQAFEGDGLLSIIESVTALPRSAQHAQTAADVVLALMSVTYTSTAIAAAAAELLEPYPNVARGFFDSPVSAQALRLASAKVPAAIDTFVLFARAYPDVAELLSPLRAYTDTVSERDPLRIDGSEVVTTEKITVFPPRPTDGQGAVTLPSGTRGQLLNQGSAGFLVMWPFQYNGWTLLGRMLENSYLTKAWSGRSLDIVRLIGTVLTRIGTDSDQLLGALSAGLERDDIIDFLSNVLESAMASPEQVSTCVAVVDFFTKLTPVLPQRVWTQLAQSRLLSKQGAIGYASSIVSSVEIFHGRYDFTVALIGLVKVLGSNYDYKNVLQERVYTDLLRHLVDVFESFEFWPYSDLTQRSAILMGTLDIFDAVLKLPGKETTRLVVEDLLGTEVTRQRAISPLLNAISNLTEGSYWAPGVQEQLSKMLAFAVELVRLRSALALPYSSLERELYTFAPQLVALYARCDALHDSILLLLGALIGASSQEQPSLLAYLGTDKSELLLRALNQTVESDLTLDETLVNVCGLFSAVGSSKQEGLWVLLVNGDDPRRKPDAGARPASLVRTLQNKLVSSSSQLSPRALAAIANALALSSLPANKKSASGSDETTDEKLIEVLVKIVKAGLDEPASNSVDGSFSIFLVGKAVSILGSQLLKEVGKRAPESKQLREFISYLSAKTQLVEFSRAFLSVEGYQAGLHGKIHELFVKAGKLADVPFDVNEQILDRSSAHLPSYGNDFVYSIPELDVVLYKDERWATFFRSDVQQANLNLSYVHAQSTLLYHWQSLCLSLATHRSAALATQLQPLAELSLKLNEFRDLAVPFLQQAVASRVCLTFFALYQLQKTGKLTPSVELLRSALGLFSDQTTGLVAASPTPQGATIYKELLKVINLELGGFVATATVDSKHQQVLLSVLEVTVIKAVRVITSEALAAPKSAAEDLVEIISILRQVLRIVGPDSPDLHGLGQLMVDSGTERAVTRLYSYSMDLDNNDPWLGEMALLYVLEWLPVGHVADNLVSNGLMTVLLESPLSRYIQQGGITAPGNPRLHSAWRNGLLMILLLLIQRLGARIVPEVVLFLESFAPQVQTCLEQWTSSAGKISVPLIEETFLLNVLLTLLASYAPKALGRAGLLDKQGLLKAMDHLASHPKYLGTRLVAPAVAAGAGVAGNTDITDDYVDVIMAEIRELRAVVEQRP